MSIEILQPKPFDLVDSKVLIAGNADGFEGHLSITVSDGHNQVTDTTTAGSGGICQFQASIDTSANVEFKFNKLFVTIADDSASEEGVPIPTVTVPVLYGPMILDGYSFYWSYEVVRGDTLWAIAERFYQDGSKYPIIHQANQHIVSDPDVIFPGQLLRIPMK